MRTVVEMGAALARGDVSAVELAEASLAAARELEARCHPFVTIDDEGALAAARDADRRRAAGEDGPLLGMARFYAPLWNHTGQPAVSLPAGRSRAGLPLAAQLVGPLGGDATLMALAAQVDRG